MDLGIPEPVRQAFLHRRDFLVMGSAGLAALCLGDLAWAAPLPATGTLPLPVAYIDGSPQILDLKHLPRDVRRPGTADKMASRSLAVVAAERVPLGDTSLVGRPLRLRILGFYPPAALTPKRRWELPRSIDLDVVFPPPDPALPAPAPFHAWSFRNGAAWNCSPPVSFVFPLDWYVYPELSLKVVPAGGGGALTMTTRFTLDDESGRPRLQRGLYLLGLQPGAWRLEGDMALLGGKAPAELFSVLLSIEPEGEAP